MPKQLFLSYSSKDKTIAAGLQRQLAALRWTVWRDQVAIAAGSEWRAAIETTLRAADAVVVLLTPNSARSDWVTYEYAFATGARRPIVALTTGKVKVPEPMRNFQIVSLRSQNAVQRAHEGLLKQIKEATAAAKAERGANAGPLLIAKFAEGKDGELYWEPTKRVCEIPMELWLANVPHKTNSVDFSVLADVEDSDWTASNKGGSRPFLDDSVSLYGDVEIVARGHLPGGRSWTTSSRLYDALVRYYTGKPINPLVRKALKQIREN